MTRFCFFRPEMSAHHGDSQDHTATQSTLHFAVLLVGLMVMAGSTAWAAQGQDDPPENRMVDDFENDSVDEAPNNWFFITSGGKVWTPERAREPGEQVFIAEEDGNRFLRFITEGEAQRYTQRNGEDFEWRLQQYPRLQWRWRAHELPEGASEKGDNDVGAALYVTFGEDWLGRPKSIKYTYSSSLPVGTVVKDGPLYIIVVDSAQEPRMGEWKTVQRDIRGDYRQVFGGSPPDEPLSITLWSDSDTTGSTARVDFDDIVFLPPR